jgi:cellulose synthase (UDP-forming)
MLTYMLVDVWSKFEIIVWRIIVYSWVVFSVIFYIWWFMSDHVGYIYGFLLTTAVISWPLFLFGYSFFFLLRMKNPDPECPVPSGLRVAMVVTKTPQEPSSVVRKTLSAVIKQVYLHDTWVADEDPTTEDLAWYRDNGVKVSCRRDDHDYHRDCWPRRKKSKEGNLSYFYDNYGYNKYDIVVHLDADHAPLAGYLEHMLRPFNDPKIGYVAAPSVCDTNANSSWAARARMHVEAIFHGPIQSGTNAGWVPICIGSHYAVRSCAIKSIGGIGPELAEDYSTTLLLNAQGWRGVWVYGARARGEGPHSFPDIIVQDYQWARSLIIIFLTIFPKVFFKLDIRQKLYFTFTQLWYPISAMVWTTSLFLISSALFTGHPPVTISFTTFLKFITPPAVLVLLALFFIRKKRMLRPEYGSVLTWENVFFEFARWPWILIASIEAILSTIFSRQHVYKVTSKGGASDTKMSLVFLIPYLSVAIVLMIAMVAGYSRPAVLGYYIMAAALALVYLFLSIVVLVMHIEEIRDERLSKKKHAAAHSPHFISIAAAVTVFVVVLSITTSRFKDYIKTERDLAQAEQKVSDLAFQLEYSKRTRSVTDSGAVNRILSHSSSTINTEYFVVSGDNLWNIAKKYYNRGSQWQRIVDANTDIKDPNYILPGDRLLILIP